VRNRVAEPAREQHDGRQRRTVGESFGWRACPVESAIGIALVVISALEIFFIVRVVSGNLNLRG
jgi:uncharacterized membrane protein